MGNGNSGKMTVNLNVQLPIGTTDFMAAGRQLGQVLEQYVGAGESRIVGVTILMPTPASGVKTELFLGGSWIDVTADADWGTGYTVRLGRTSPLAAPNPSSCSVLLRNPTGKYTPGVQIKE